MEEMTTMKQNIWIDTDPGIDDAIAIAAAAAASDRLHLCGISTVAGNQSIDKVTHNALWLTELLGTADCPVVKGAQRPLIRQPQPAAHIHGEHGLGYIKPDVYRRSLTSDQGAYGIWHELQKLGPDEKVSILCIAPLTNIALLLRAFPDIRQKIDQIILMGGSMVEGNKTATGEFNIWADPEAAEIVFQSEIPIVMCGLDVTMQSYLTDEDVQTLENGTQIQRQFGKMLRFYLDSPAYRGKGRVAMHDSVPVLYLLHEELFTGEHHVMHVSCTEETCRGMTVICDGAFTYTADPNERKNVYVLKTADSDRFRTGLMDLLLRYS